MKPEDAEEYTQALGQVVAGGWRQIALGERLGVPQALGLSVDEWVKQRLGGYVKLSIEERRQAVAELTAEGLKQRKIADVLGVGLGTVNEDLQRVQNRTSEPQKLASEAAPVTAYVQDRTPEPLDVLSNLEKVKKDLGLDELIKDKKALAKEARRQSRLVRKDPKNKKLIEAWEEIADRSDWKC